MAEKYQPEEEKKESLPTKALKCAGAVLAFAIGIDILRNH